MTPDERDPENHDAAESSQAQRPGDTPREDAMNEHDENNLPHDERHERLCAYAFGELEGDERSAFEAELSGDPQLKAELERLQATISLVNTHGGGALALSEGAAAQLADKVQAAKPAPVIQLAWYQKPWLKVAAALAVMGGVGYVLDAGGAFGEPGSVQREASSGLALGDLGQTADAPAAARALETPLLKEQPQLEGAPLPAVDSLAAAELHNLGYEDVELEVVETLTDELGLGGGAGGGAAPSAGRRASGGEFARAAVGGVTAPGRLRGERQIPITGSPSAPNLGAPTGVFTGPPMTPGPDSGGPTTGPITGSLHYKGAGDTVPPRVAGGAADYFLGDGFKLDLSRLDVDSDFDFGELGTPSLAGGEGDLPVPAEGGAVFLQLERERMQAAGLDSTGWVQLLKQFEYLPQDFEGAFDDPETQAARFRLLEPVLREQRLNELLLDVQRRPGETLDRFYYRHWGTRPFQATADDPQSTFSADVDTASYALARKMLTQGVFPTRDQIRVEEFVNYFDAGLPAPGSGDPGLSGDANFALSAELAPAPFGPSDEPTWLLRVGAKAREVDQSQRSPLNLTFVVDTSGSMDMENRKELVKGALRLLVNQLDGRDTISIVRFSTDATTLIEPTPANQRGRILAAIDLLSANGGTNVEAGLLHGYNVAATAFDQAKVNRVVFLSDGVGNIGETDQERILAQATDQRGLGIYLNTIGVGLENHNDVFLEQLADNGDGLCNYVGDAIEARKALVENFTGAFEPVARDVKLQVTFDPARVGKYRLLGYENRAIADRDFANSKVDAAELNAGHEVVALYELQGVQFDGEAPLGTFKLRYKAPFGDEQHMDELERDAETELGLTLSGALSQFDWRTASLGYQRGALAAQVAEVLRRSGHAKGDDFDGMVADIKRVADASTDADFREFAGLIERNQAAIAALAPEPSEAQDLLDQLKYAQYELELERSAEGEPDAAKIAAKEAVVQALEQKLRDLVLVGLAQTEETLESPGGEPLPEGSFERLGYVDIEDSEEG